MNGWRGLVPYEALQISEPSAQCVNSFCRDYDPTPKRQWVQVTYPDSLLAAAPAPDSPETIAAFAELAQRTSLTKLSFTRRMQQQQPSSGVTPIVPLFRHLKVLSFVDVTDAPGAVAVLLMQENALRSLMIANLTSLSSCKELSAVFRSHPPPLKSLQFVASLRSSRHPETADSVTELISSLPNLTRLRDLSLRVLITQPVAQNIAQVVSATPFLRFLDLTGCGLTEAHFAIILPSLSESPLRRLHLPQNRDLGSAAICALAKLLPPSLCVLDISDTDAKDEGAIALIQAISSHYSHSVQSLNLNGNRLTDKSGEVLRQALSNGVELRCSMAMRIYSTATKTNFVEEIVLGWFKKIIAPNARKLRMRALRNLYGCLLLLGMNRTLPYADRSPLSRLPSDLLLLIFTRLEERCVLPVVPNWVAVQIPDSRPPKLRTFFRRVLDAPEGALKQALAAREASEGSKTEKEEQEQQQQQQQQEQEQEVLDRKNEQV